MSPVPRLVQPLAAALPPDFDQWPAPERMVWKELVGSRGWRASGWAWMSFAELGEAIARTRDRPQRYERASIRRWMKCLVARGEFARRYVRRGEALPDGSDARGCHWIVVPGETMKARAGAAPEIPGGIIFDPQGDHGTAPSVPDVKRARSGKQAQHAPEEATGTAPARRDALRLKEDSLLSSLSGPESRSETLKLRSKLGESERRKGESASPPLAAPVRLLAERLLRRYAEASGVRVAHFRAGSRALVAACLDEMEGDDAAKEMRLGAVIADAINESRRRGIAHPPLAYVFNVRHVRRRLERLAEAEHLAEKAAVDAEGGMFVAGFDAAMRDARAELAAGRTPAAALERARPFVESGRVTDAKRLEAFHGFTGGARRRPPSPLAKTARPAPRTAQDAPQRNACPLGSASRLPERSRTVSGPEDALRVLQSLFATVQDPPPTTGCVAELPLTTAERAELELAQQRARVRWTRAG